MSCPKVSVVIPIYGTEKFLAECLDSVLNQSLSDIEVVCVNDCSPDNCQNILDEYAARDERVKIVVHPENKGLPAARNTGMNASRGEYIRNLDSDDILQEDSLEKMYSFAKANDSDIVRAGGTLLRNGNLVESHHHLPYKKNVPLTTLDECPLLWPLVGTVFYMYKRSFLLQNSLTYLEGIFQHEDYIFLSRALSKAKRVSLLAHSCYIYRIVRKGPMTHKGAMEQARAITLIRDNWSGHQKVYLAWINYMRQPYAELLLLAVNRYSRENAISVLKAFRDIYSDIPVPEKITKVWAVCTDEEIIKGIYRLLNTVSPEEFITRVKNNTILDAPAKAGSSVQNLPDVDYARLLNELYDSKSWKITRPLRWIVDKIIGR